MLPAHVVLVENTGKESNDYVGLKKSLLDRETNDDDDDDDDDDDVNDAAAADDDDDGGIVLLCMLKTRLDSST
ncbi:hypothetical protein ElyMa_003652500 [Elysia marginata]|uniref:Uncharacterized protein n=1 Tax=Elysia marginata TaxID=1093978 RepID=A0AAV4EXI8_9GAST|nr:hypothetical protein ElyMa_003652500 [Elysia marginata]